MTLCKLHPDCVANDQAVHSCPLLDRATVPTKAVATPVGIGTDRCGHAWEVPVDGPVKCADCGKGHAEVVREQERDDAGSSCPACGEMMLTGVGVEAYERHTWPLRARIKQLEQECVAYRAQLEGRLR